METAAWNIIWKIQNNCSQYKLVKPIQILINNGQKKGRKLLLVCEKSFATFIYPQESGAFLGNNSGLDHQQNKTTTINKQQDKYNGLLLFNI